MTYNIKGLGTITTSEEIFKTIKDMCSYSCAYLSEYGSLVDESYYLSLAIALDRAEVTE